MTAKEQYREAYRLNREFHAAVAGKDVHHQRAIARAFIALGKQQGIDWRIDYAARDSYLQRLSVPGPSPRYLIAKFEYFTRQRHA